MKSSHAPKRKPDLIYPKGKVILSLQFLPLWWSLIGVKKVEKEKESRSSFLKSRGSPATLLKARVFLSALLGRFFWLLKFFWMELLHIAVSKYQKMWDLKTKPLFQFSCWCLCVFLPVAVCPVPVVFAPLDFTCCVWALSCYSYATLSNLLNTF